MEKLLDSIKGFYQMFLFSVISDKSGLQHDMVTIMFHCRNVMLKLMFSTLHVLQKYDQSIFFYMFIISFVCILGFCFENTKHI